MGAMRRVVALCFSVVLLVVVIADEGCPDNGLHAHGRCWYFSAPGGNCATSCFVHGLNFSLYIPGPDAPIIPRLLGYEMQPRISWGRLECLRVDIGGYHPAKRHADLTSGDTTASPNVWSTLRCQMACPCAGGSTLRSRSQHQAIESRPVCGLGFQQRINCCLDDVTDCWQGWSWVSLKAHRRCCGAMEGECPSFGEAVRLDVLPGSVSRRGVEVCLHRPEIAHDVIEDKIRKRLAPYDCDLLHRLAALMVRTRGKQQPLLQVVDVGANVGACSLAVADLGADVVAIEANPRVFALLNASAHRRASGRGAGRVLALNYAASDQVGLTIILEPKGNAGGGSTLMPDLARTVIYDGVTLISSSTDGPGGITQENTQRNWPAETQRLDQVLPKVGVDHIDILKIDAEGDEFKVLRGMRGLFADPARTPQIIKLEFHPMRLQAKSEDPQDLLHWLLRRHYTLFLLRAVGSMSLANSCRISSLQAATEICRQFSTRVLDIMTDVVAVSDQALYGGALGPELLSPSTGQAPALCVTGS